MVFQHVVTQMLKSKQKSLMVSFENTLLQLFSSFAIVPL